MIFPFNCKLHSIIPNQTITEQVMVQGHFMTFESEDIIYMQNWVSMDMKLCGSSTLLKNK